MKKDMKHYNKKLPVFLLLASAFVWLAFSAPPDPDPEPGGPFPVLDYEQEPPFAEHCWVQKLPSPLAGGENMIMKIQFSDLHELPATLDIYYGDNNTVIFHDDGNAPDETADDNIFAAYVIEDIPTFTAKLQDMHNQLSSAGSFLRFAGHLGEEVTDIATVDLNAFEVGDVMYLDWDLLNGIICDWNLAKEKSLFITDLSVVEDPARTFRVDTPAGNPNGIWTFGSMMRNMAGVLLSTGVLPRDFLKAWVRNWTIDQTINGQFVPKRANIIPMVIAPWLKQCGITQTVTLSNWESLWDSPEVSESELLWYAPFKLTAIVNRIDLRGSSIFTRPITNSGETRFIFSLIQPESVTESIGGTVPAGAVPKNRDQAENWPNFLDWEGMNVIFEYGNVQTTACQLRDFAQAWLNLSYLPFPSPAYNDALEDITETVINIGAAPSRINASAINRIRTNERVLQVVNPSKTVAGWKTSDWEFRQFELNAATHVFEQVPLTNTPVNSANRPVHSSSQYPPYNSIDAANLTNCAFAPLTKATILRGTHNLPTIGAGVAPLAAAARVDLDFVHYWELDWYVQTPNFNMYTPPPNNEILAVRQQLSLNTCQGCHTGETETKFTHVLPLGYGETANYWDPVPDHTTGRDIDVRFHNNTHIYPGNPSGNFVKVSAFLTGRTYSNASYQDDIANAGDDALDHTMDGLFYVKDPANGVGIDPSKHWGYNDLQRRKNDLCQLIGSSCSMSVVIDIAKQVSFTPFAIGAH